MTHLVRAGAIIIAIFAVIIFLRVVPVPPFLETYGFYREKDNSEEWAGQPVQFAEPENCSSCHQQKYEAWKEANHRTVICEDCHGPGIPHIEKGTDLAVDTSRDLCGTCHDTTPARPSEFPQIDLKEHGDDLECITCHDPHAPVAPKNPAIPHTLEGRTECLTCHGPGGFLPVPADHNERSQETCLSCHQEK